MGLSNAFVQVCVIGMLAFCGPGMFNAMNGLGAAGSGDPKAAAVTNGCLYATFAVVGYFAGSIFNVLGPRISFTVGGISYSIYALCVYYGTVSLALPAVGGLQLGVGAGLFWCAQMALCIAYSTEHNKSTYMATFWVIFNLGGVIGGFIQMALNWNLFSMENGGIYTSEGNRASAASYFSFIGIMVCSVVIVWTLLRPPAKVIKADGTSPAVQNAEPFIKELKDAAKGIADPFVLKMIPYFLFSNWFYTYEFTYLNNFFFNSRAAGCNSGVYWGAQMLGAAILPLVTDKKSWSVKKRGKAGLALNVLWLTISWALAMVVTFTSAGGMVDKDQGFENAAWPAGGAPKAMAWFPDVCDQFPEIDAYWGEGTCTTGCDFLRYCRITPASDERVHANVNGFYDTVSNNFICDFYFPRCSDDGENKTYEMTNVAKCIDDFGPVMCFDTDVPDTSAEEKEFSKGNFDIKKGESDVCSSTRYFDGDVISTEANDADTLCSGIMDGIYLKGTPSPEMRLNPSLWRKNNNWVAPHYIYNPNGPAELTPEDYCSTVAAPLGVCAWTDNECRAVSDFDFGAVFRRRCLTMHLDYSSESALIIATYAMMGISDATYQTLVLWLIGAVVGGDLKMAARYSAAYKGIQSAGAAIAWLTDLQDGFTYMIQSFVCIAFAALAIIGVLFVLPMLDRSSAKDHSVEASPSKLSSSSSISESTSDEPDKEHGNASVALPSTSRSSEGTRSD